MSMTRKTADLSNRRSTNECRTIGIDRQVNKKQKQKCKVSHVISCPITRELVHFCSVIHQHHTLCHWSSRRDLRNETTAEVRNATHFFLLIRKHESSSRPKHCPCYYSSSWAICMGHSSAKLLWEQIQGHVRLEHTQDSPIFPCFHSLNILSLLFFFKSTKWRLHVFFRESNVLFKMPCEHHEFYMTEAPSHNIPKPLPFSQQGCDPAANRCAISHWGPCHGAESCCWLTYPLDLVWDSDGVYGGMPGNKYSERQAFTVNQPIQLSISHGRLTGFGINWKLPLHSNHSYNTVTYNTGCTSLEAKSHLGVQQAKAVLALHRNQQVKDLNMLLPLLSSKPGAGFM